MSGCICGGCGAGCGIFNGLRGSGMRGGLFFSLGLPGWRCLMRTRIAGSGTIMATERTPEEGALYRRHVERARHAVKVLVWLHAMWEVDEEDDAAQEVCEGSVDAYWNYLNGLDLLDLKYALTLLLDTKGAKAGIRQFLDEVYR